MKNLPTVFIVEAFLITTMIPAILFLLFAYQAADLWLLVLYSFAVFVITSLHTLFLAVPFFLVCESKDCFNWASAILGGLGVGIFPHILYSISQFTTSEFQFDVRELLVFGLLGAFCGFIVWLYLLIRMKFYLRRR